MEGYAKIGKIVPLHRGDYDAETSYRVNDIVNYQKSIYWHKGSTATTGVAPTDKTVWALVISPVDAVLGMIPELTLPAAGWSGGSITVSAEGVTASNHVIVAPSPASRDAYINADVRCTAQGAGTLTFAAAATPSANIGVNVLIIKV